MFSKLSLKNQTAILLLLFYVFIVSPDFGYDSAYLNPYSLAFAMDSSEFGSCMFTVNQTYRDQIKLLESSQAYLNQLNAIASVAVLLVTKNPILVAAAFASLEYARFIDYSDELTSLMGTRDGEHEQCRDLSEDQSPPLAAQPHAGSIENHMSSTIAYRW
ncbi:MAG: hypothetical protein NPIRA05_01480 [Nitrospirales bacterium]|nr:MAG: hypothetical protein NPIRA05_01480 [Nitrospirales bacterium]